MRGEARVLQLECVNLLPVANLSYAGEKSLRETMAHTDGSQCPPDRDDFTGPRRLGPIGNEQQPILLFSPPVRAFHEGGTLGPLLKKLRSPEPFEFRSGDHHYLSSTFVTVAHVVSQNDSSVNHLLAEARFQGGTIKKQADTAVAAGVLGPHPIPSISVTHERRIAMVDRAGIIARKAGQRSDAPSSCRYQKTVLPVGSQGIRPATPPPQDHSCHGVDSGACSCRAG